MTNTIDTPLTAEADAQEEGMLLPRQPQLQSAVMSMQDALGDIHVTEAAAPPEETAEIMLPIRRQKDRQTIDRRLYFANTMLTNATDEEILRHLEAAGFAATELVEGRQLYDFALTLHQEVHALHGEQRGDTQRFKESRRRTRFAYMRDLRIARRVFAQDPDAVRVLLLRGERKQSFGTWVGQVTHFYAQLLSTPIYLEKLARVGLKAPILVQHQARVEELLQLQLRRERIAGDAKQRKRERDAAVKHLDLWIASLVAVVEVALLDKPGLLAKLTL